VIRYLALAAMLVGCFEARAYPALKSRAAFDMGCAETDLTLRELGTESQVGVTGCSKKATYVFQQGAWVMNTPTGAPEAATATATTATATTATPTTPTTAATTTSQSGAKQ
jgi:hypothetical protein